MPNRVAMLRSHHLRGFVKLVLWDVYCLNGFTGSRVWIFSVRLV